MYTTLPDSQCGVPLGQRILFGGSLEIKKSLVGGRISSAMMKWGTTGSVLRFHSDDDDDDDGGGGHGSRMEKISDWRAPQNGSTDGRVCDRET